MFKAVIMVQLFYGLAISLLAYSLPPEAITFVQGFSDISANTDFKTISSEIQGSIEEQANMPVIELGALVYYSGNIIIDMILNTVLAIPEMMTLIVNGLCMLINLDTYVTSMIQLYAGVTFTILYFISIIQLLTNIRSGRVI